MLASTFLLLLAVSLGSYFLAACAAAAHLRASREDPGREPLPPLSFLKPLKGLEEGLKENLESFFVQEYPGAWELVFITTDSMDPALHVVQELEGRYPRVRTRRVLAGETAALNPKVSNLIAGVGEAVYDLQLQTDGNVRVRQRFARDLVAEFLGSDASIATCLPIGKGEKSIGAALQNLHLTSFIVPAMCFADRFAGITCICGKAMLFRRSELANLGGIERFGSFLAEDFLMGRAYQQANLRPMLARATTVENINVRCRSSEFFNRHQRWLIMELLVHRFGFVCNFLGNPMLFALLAWMAAAFDPVVGLITMGTVIVKIAVDCLLAHRLRGNRVSLAHSLLIPLKDLAVAGLWVRSLWLRTIVWRGTIMQLGPGSEILQTDHAPARPRAFTPAKA